MTQLEPTSIFIVDDDPTLSPLICEIARELGHEVRILSSFQALIDVYDGAHPACVILNPRCLFRWLGLEGANDYSAEDTNQALVASGHAVMKFYHSFQKGRARLLSTPYRKPDVLESVKQAIIADTTHYTRRIRRNGIRNRINTLTPHEKQVLERVVDGKANKVIARELDVALRTVELRRQKILQKMHVDSVAELVRAVTESEQSDRMD